MNSFMWVTRISPELRRPLWSTSDLAAACRSYQDDILKDEHVVIPLFVLWNSFGIRSKILRSILTWTIAADYYYLKAISTLENKLQPAIVTVCVHISVCLTGMYFWEDGSPLTWRRATSFNRWIVCELICLDRNWPSPRLASKYKIHN